MKPGEVWSVWTSDRPQEARIVSAGNVYVKVEWQDGLLSGQTSDVPRADLIRRLP